MPLWLRDERDLVRIARGCYSVQPSWTPFLWIAANELPLCDELVPFLVARSGDALDEFARWVASRRPFEWVLAMVEYTSMSATVSDELLRKFGPVDDPEIEARRQKILRFLLETSPDVRQELLEKGRLLGARSALRGVLEQRGLLLTSELDERLEQCTDFTTLQRWMMQAVTAATAAEALR
jgi:hypothetical protein